MLTFKDVFSGYNQILMTEEDQEKTVFITSQGLYCYRVMPFGLKNAGATYQRLVNQMFSEQIGRNRNPFGRIGGNIRNSETVPDEIEPNEVCIRGFLGKVLRLYGVITRHKS